MSRDDIIKIKTNTFLITYTIEHGIENDYIQEHIAIKESIEDFINEIFMGEDF